MDLSLEQVLPLTFVIPCCNEAQSLPTLFTEFQSIWTKKRVSVLFVDDGSTDDTVRVLSELQSSYPNIGYIQLTRNFGKEVAISAGLDNVPKDSHVIVMDGDGQHTRAAVDKLIARAIEAPDYNIIFGARSERAYQTRAERFWARFYYKTLNLLTSQKFNSRIGDFYIGSPYTADIFRRFKDKRLFWKGIYGWSGIDYTLVEIDIPKRLTSETKFTSFAKVLHALNGILLTTSLPLKIISIVGLLVSFFSFLVAVYFISKYLFLGVTTAGFYTLVVLQGFIGGMILVSLGIIAQYLALIKENTSTNPQYILSSKSKLPDFDRK